MKPIVRLNGAIAERVELGIGQLTDRQREVLALVCSGLTAAEAAERLGISRRGVEAHLVLIKKTIGVQSLMLIAVHTAALEARAAPRKREGILTHF